MSKSASVVSAPDSVKPVRVDAWLWAVRIFKTRSSAATAVKAGHVKVNGGTVKPSQHLAVGDRVRVWVDHRLRDLEVSELIARRVGAAIARTCYVDHSPPPPSPELLASMPQRDRGAGRPTKKERRQLDRLRAQ